MLTLSRTIAGRFLFALLILELMCKLNSEYCQSVPQGLCPHEHWILVNGLINAFLHPMISFGSILSGPAVLFVNISLIEFGTFSSVMIKSFIRFSVLGRRTNLLVKILGSKKKKKKIALFNVDYFEN